jgi:hypothetical protein
MAAHAASPNVTSMDVMLAVMRDPDVALEMRVKMGLKALPHLHRKLRAGETGSVAGDGPLPTRRRQKLSLGAQGGNELSVGNPVNEAAEMMSDSATPTKGEESRSVVAASVVSADVVIAKDGVVHSADLMPLPFLLGILNNIKTPAAIKVKVACATLPYTHSRQSGRPAKPSVVADRFGFTVEHALARKLGNEIARLGILKKRRNPHPRDHKAIQKLNGKIDAKLAMLQCPCPSWYGAKQAATDKEKIDYLWRKRRSRRKLTPNEDAALAHINARYWAFACGAEAQARARLRLLKDKERIHRRANGQPLSPREKGELNALTILYPPKQPEPNADHEAFLERVSMFSNCLLDADGFPMEYRRPVCRAPESIRAPTSEAAAVQPNDPGPQPAPEPEPEEDFVEFVEVPPFCTVDRELSAKKGRLILKFTYEI